MLIKELGKKFSWAFIVAGIIMILLGVFLLVKPLASVRTVIIIIGIGLILYGIMHFVAYARMDVLPGVGFIMLTGILDVLLGLIFIFSWDTVAASIPFFLGFWMLFSGVSRITAAFTAKKFGEDGWWMMLIYGILLIICGYYFFANPLASGWAVMVVLSVYLISDGISAIIGAIGVRRLSGRIEIDEPRDL